MTWKVTKKVSMIQIIPIDMFLHTIVIGVGITGYDLDLLYYDNVERMTDEERKIIKNDITTPSSCNGMTMTLDSGTIFVYIRKGKERDISVVAHELYHAVNRLLYRVGVRRDEDDEACAYLLGWLMQEYFKQLNEFENENQKG